MTAAATGDGWAVTTTTCAAPPVARNRPSLYAAPVAWMVADVVGALVAGRAWFDPERCGLIVASDECSLTTVAELSATAAQGRVSPLRFAGASPSIVAGLAALEHAIRGPVLCLTMPPGRAADAVAALARYWLRHSGIDAVIAVGHARDAAGAHRLTGLVVHGTATDLTAAAARFVELADGGITAPSR